MDELNGRKSFGPFLCQSGKIEDEVCGGGWKNCGKRKIVEEKIVDDGKIVENKIVQNRKIVKTTNCGRQKLWKTKLRRRKIVEEKIFAGIKKRNIFLIK